MGRRLSPGLVCAALLAPAAAVAQAAPSAPFLHAPRLGGAAVFIAPRASAPLGPLHLDGELELGWGASNAYAARGFAGVALPWDLRLTAGWSGSDVDGSEERQDEHVLMLGLAAPRAGISAGRRRTTSAFADFRSVVTGADARGWIDLGTPLSLNLGVSVRTSDVVERGGAVWQRRIVVGGYEFVSTRVIEYLDAANHRDLEVDVSASLGRLRVTGVLGHGSSAGPADPRSWGYGRVETPILHGLEARLEAGTHGGIPAIGRLTGGFVRLGLRLDLSAMRDDVPTEPAMPERSVAGLDGPSTAAFEEQDGVTLMVLHLPDASAVEVKGDFTAWEPRAMSPRGDGSWTVALHPGVLRFNIRVDAGAWHVPAGLPSVPDEFTGAPVAVVAVPRE